MIQRTNQLEDEFQPKVYQHQTHVNSQDVPTVFLLNKETMKTITKTLQTLRISLIAIVLIGFTQVDTCAQNAQQQGIEVPKKTMETYVGSYEMQKDNFLKIEIQKDELKAIGPDKTVYDLIPINNIRFFLKEFGVDIEFVKNDDNKIIKLLMIREDGQQLEAIRVEQ